MVRQEAGKSQLVKIRSTKRRANRRRTNPYTEAATESVKLRDGMYQAGVKASVLSSEKINIVEVDTVIFGGRRNGCKRHGKFASALPESKATA
jgi:hypothetical protein